MAIMTFIVPRYVFFIKNPRTEHQEYYKLFASLITKMLRANMRRKFNKLI